MGLIVWIAVWAAVVWGWRFCKKRSRRNGVDLLYNPRTGTCTEYCPYESAARRLGVAVLVLGIPLALYVAYLLVSMPGKG